MLNHRFIVLNDNSININQSSLLQRKNASSVENLSISTITRRMDMLNVISNNCRSNIKDTTLNLTDNNPDQELIYDEDGNPIENIQNTSVQKDIKINNNKSSSQSFVDLDNTRKSNNIKVSKGVDGVDRLS